MSCPNGGDIVAHGKNLCEMKSADLDEYRKTIGVLFQSGALFNSMNVAENVALPLREHTDLAEQTIDDHCEDQAGARRPCANMPTRCPRSFPAE